MIKLTGIPNPDVNGGKSQPVYIDGTRVLVIEPSAMRLLKKGSNEAWNQAMNSLHDEVQRIASELGTYPISMVVDSEESEKRLNDWTRAKEAASSLSAAYGIVAKAGISAAHHPEIECTAVSLACGTGLEHGVMLCRVYVVESPEEVARMIDEVV